jgi:hypothetical protein
VWTLSHNEELCGLLERPDIVKCSYVQVAITNIPKKSAEWEISCKKTYGKTTTEKVNNRREFSLPLRRLMGDSDIWRQNCGKGPADVGYRASEE